MKLRNRRRLHSPDFYSPDSDSKRSRVSKSPASNQSKLEGRSSKRSTRSSINRSDSPITTNSRLSLRNNRSPAGRGRRSASDARCRSQSASSYRSPAANRRSPASTRFRRTYTRSPRGRRKTAAKNDPDESKSEESEDSEETVDDAEEGSDGELEKSKESGPKIKRPVANKDEEDPETANANAAQSSQYFQILLRRKMSLGVLPNSGQSTQSAVVDVSEQVAEPKSIDNREQIIASNTTVSKQHAVRPFPVVASGQSSRVVPPYVVQSTRAQGPGSLHSVQKPVITRQNSAAPTFKYLKSQPISCPICFELFTTADNDTALENHLRVYHYVYWLRQTNSDEFPTKEVLRMLEKKKKEEVKVDVEIDFDDRYVPNCDTVPCRSCASRGIKCGLAGSILHNSGADKR